MSGRTARRLVVTGDVQGVSFRDSCREEARAAGVHGWVANAGDGSVHAHVEGAAEDLERLVAWVRRGPRQARVDHVAVDDAEPEDLDGFEVR
jgi:acylphosphatase